MLNRLLNRGRPSVGDGVEIIAGPYAGKAGVVTRAEANDLDVFIDDCCRPTLQASEVRRMRRRSLQQAVRQARESDPIGEEARATTEIRDWVDSMGPH
jgi:ribosomal protein L24